MEDSKSILLTGATGFLGSHILNHLVSSGYHVICLKRSFSDTTRINNISGKFICYDIDNLSVESIFKNHNINIVLHTATLYGRNDELATDIINSNILFPATLVELGIKYGVEAFINTDTFINNKNISYDYLNNYTLSKRHLLDWLTTYSNKIKIVNCKLWHLYGPKDDKAKFIVNIARSLLGGASHLDLTDGSQKRDFIYVDDVVTAYLTIISNLNKLSFGINEFEIGSGSSVTVKEVIQELKGLSKNEVTELRFGALPQRQGEYSDSKADISKLTSLGWYPNTELQTGLLKTLLSENTQYLKTIL